MPGRVPAEWEKQESVWLARPHDSSEWGDFFDAACKTVDAFALALASKGSVVDLLVPEDSSSAIETRLLPDSTNATIRSHQIPYGDIWLRDTAPIFAIEEGQRLANNFAFNGWGNKYVFKGDAEVGLAIAAAAQTEARSHGFVLEGGAIDGNGEGTFLTTKQCLLNPNRNPEMSTEDVEMALAESLHCRELIWLEEGLLGDHTDGHIDNLARFVAPTTVVHPSTKSQSDPNRGIYQAAQRELQRARTANGQALTLIELPSPGPIKGPEGIMAASYCNFFISNSCVALPVFGVSQDLDAIAILSELFSDRVVLAIEAYALLTGGGTLHCISQQMPALR